jgi:hypothetical protein
MMRAAVLFVLSLLMVQLLPASGAAQAEGGAPVDDARVAAQRLWEQAVAAKGGRERLYAVRNFMVSSNSRYGSSPRPDVAAGVAEENLYVLPGKWWSFQDYRPGKMGYSLDVLDFERDIWWHTGPGKRVPLTPRADVRREIFENFKGRFHQAQLIYLMETQAVKPEILRARTAHDGLKKVDVVETLVDGSRVDFYLDRKTHLPSRIVMDIPGTRSNGRMDYSCRLGDYLEVNSIQMPQRVDCLDKESRMTYRFNVPYDEAVFERPPTPDMSAGAWKAPAN